MFCPNNLFSKEIVLVSCRSEAFGSSSFVCSVIPCAYLVDSDTPSQCSTGVAKRFLAWKDGHSHSFEGVLLPSINASPKFTFYSSFPTTVLSSRLGVGGYQTKNDRGEKGMLIFTAALTEGYLGDSRFQFSRG